MRETIKLTKETLVKLANSWDGSPINYDGDNYVVEKHNVPDDDHSKHTIVFKRESDGKYFKFTCLIVGPYTDNKNYKFEEDFPDSASEVFPKVTFE